MQQLHINNDLFYIPSSWNELTREQLLKIAELSHNGSALHYFFTHLIITITDLIPEPKMEVEKDGETLFWFKNGKKKYLISANDFSFICKKLQFLFSKKSENGVDTYYLNSTLTKNLIPSVIIDKIEYFGPSDALTNLLFEEYIHTETFLDRLKQTKSDQYINKLIAVLYRPWNGIDKSSLSYKGDLREPFNDFLTDQYARIMAKLPDATKEAIILYYTGSREFIVHKFREVFKSGKSSEDVFSSFMILVNSLADSDVTKKEQVRKSYLYDVMSTLQELSIQAEKLKKI